jgi:SPP1 family phage portal protein
MTTGYLTVNNLIALKLMADKANLDTARISDLITTDLSSPLKKRMKEGVDYYHGKHDILNHVNYYYVDGVAQEDKVRANNKLPHPFHKILVDQKAAYIAGNPVVVSVVEGNESKKFQELLTEQLGLDFDELLTTWIIGASNKSLEWVHFYIDPSGGLQFCIVPAEQIIPVYDSQYERELIYVIRFYLYDLVDANGSTAQRYKVEWWTKDKVEYWAQQVDGTFVHDPDAELGSAFHWYTFNTSNPSEKTGNSWGRLPFVCLSNNPELHTDLQDIKTLIDAYDLVKSGWMNDIQDFVNAIYVLKGFQGLSGEAQAGLSALALFMKNL